MDKIPSWNLYFTADEYTHHNDNIPHIQILKKHFSTLTPAALSTIYSTTTFPISQSTFQKLTKSDSENTIKCISAAVSDLLVENGFPTIQIRLKITQFNSFFTFDEVNTENIGKLVVLKGTVCRIGSRKVSFRKMHFECVRCKETIVLTVENHFYRPPKKCKNGCKSRLFTVQLDNDEIRLKDYQEIKIQEIFYESKMPSVIEAVLFENDVGTVGPGDVVELAGIVKAEYESKDLYKLGVNVINIECKDKKSYFYLDSLNRDEKDLSDDVNVDCSREETTTHENIQNIENIEKFSDDVNVDCSREETIYENNQNNENIQNIENNERIQNNQNIENIQNNENIQSMKNIENIEKILSIKNIENSKNYFPDDNELIINEEENPNFKNVVTKKSIFSFEKIKKISEKKDLLKILVHSVFPDVFGNELIKLGLLLSIFGGSEKFADETRVRDTIHVLIIGDPGLGKSKMLLSVSNLLPKTSYVTGNLTTTAGLTVSLVHDPVNGDFVIEAGALILSDGGICCLDEFDKINNHKCLFEVMEEQKVTVAKAGVVCSVPARTTVIAATNPKFGHFRKDVGLEKNVKFDEALIARFDLVFVLVDTLDETHNAKVCNFILNNEENRRNDDSNLRDSASRGSVSRDSDKKYKIADKNCKVVDKNCKVVDTKYDFLSKNDDFLNDKVLNKNDFLNDKALNDKALNDKALNDKALDDKNDKNHFLNDKRKRKSFNTDNIIERLKRDNFLFEYSNPHESEKLEVNDLKEYLNYARNTVNPILSTQAKSVLKSFYFSIRERVTCRALESLVRLCEARARVELRGIASKSDAEFVVELYKRTLFKEEKKVEKKGVKGFIELLRESGSEIVTSEEIGEMMKKCGIGKGRDEFVEMLNFKGILLRKGKAVFQVII